MTRGTFLGPALALLCVAGGCATARHIPGTTVEDNDQNRRVIETIEAYRQRMVERNIEGMLALASKNYFEDGGTPRPDDDYGYEGLKDVLAKGLARVRAVHYQIQYRKVRIDRDKAEVEVFLNGSFEIMSEIGERYRRKNDFHQFVLERQGDRWKFLSGM